MVSAGFCHLLGDAIEQLTKAVKYPLAPFLCACGFMSTLVADQIVEVVTAKPREHPVLVRPPLQGNPRSFGHPHRCPLFRSLGGLCDGSRGTGKWRC